jgi:hypothetical protein
MNSSSWLNILKPSPGIDGPARVVVMLVVAVLLVLYSMSFEVAYSRPLVELYMFPWWRLLVIVLIVTAALWCPRVGAVVALAAFFYLADVGTLLTPFASPPAKALA